MTSMKTKRTKTSPTSRPSSANPTKTSSLLKKVFEVSLWATLIQDPSARRTKDSQPSGFGFEYCASHVRFRVFQQTVPAFQAVRAAFEAGAVWGLSSLASKNRDPGGRRRRDQRLSSHATETGLHARISRGTGIRWSARNCRPYCGVALLLVRAADGGCHVLRERLQNF